MRARARVLCMWGRRKEACRLRLERGIQQLLGKLLFFPSIANIVSSPHPPLSFYLCRRRTFTLKSTVTYKIHASTHCHLCFAARDKLIKRTKPEREWESLNCIFSLCVPPQGESALTSKSWFTNHPFIVSGSNIDLGFGGTPAISFKYTLVTSHRIGDHMFNCPNQKIQTHSLKIVQLFYKSISFLCN